MHSIKFNEDEIKYIKSSVLTDWEDSALLNQTISTRRNISDNFVVAEVAFIEDGYCSIRHGLITPLELKEDYDYWKEKGDVSSNESYMQIVFNSEDSLDMMKLKTDIELSNIGFNIKKLGI